MYSTRQYPTKFRMDLEASSAEEYQANKQFIAPLPIPSAKRAGRAMLSALASGMQQRHSCACPNARRSRSVSAATARTRWPLERLLLDVRPVAAIEDAVPRSVPPSDRKRWVDDQAAADEEAALARIDG